MSVADAETAVLAVSSLPMERFRFFTENVLDLGSEATRLRRLVSRHGGTVVAAHYGHLWFADDPEHRGFTQALVTFDADYDEAAGLRDKLIDRLLGAGVSFEDSKLARPGSDFMTRLDLVSAIRHQDCAYLRFRNSRRVESDYHSDCEEFDPYELSACGPPERLMILVEGLLPRLRHLHLDERAGRLALAEMLDFVVSRDGNTAAGVLANACRSNLSHEKVRSIINDIRLGLLT